MVADGYKDTEIGIIPIEWDVKLFEDLKFDISDGNYSSKYPKQSDFIQEGVPFIRANNIKNMTVIHKDMRHISINQHNELKKGHLKQGDVLITTRGDIGQIALVPDEFIDANINAQIVRIGVSEKVNNKYLAYFLIQQNIQNIIKSLETGTALKQLPVKKLGLLPISIPPLKEQKQIAEILSTADNKIDAIAIQIEKAETLKKGLLQKLLSEGIGHSVFKDSELGKIPEKWEVVELNSILTIQRGASPRPINKFITEDENAVSWIKIGDIKKDAKYITKTKQKITDEGAKKSRAIKPKDFVLSNSMSFGRPYISKIYGCIHDGWLLLRNKDENILSNNFLYEILSADLAKKQFKKFAAGSTVNNLKSETVSTLIIPLPPLEEQKQIADILSTADEKLEVLKAKKDKYETLKKGLLQKLLSGEVRV